jgi:ketosteroid isomerase-like protein
LIKASSPHASGDAITRLPVIGFLLLLAGCDPTAPPPKGDDKADIQAVYDAIARGVESRDIEAVTAYSLPAATVRFADGTELTLADWKEKARPGWGSVRSTKSKVVVETVRTTGDAAEVNYNETHDLVMIDPAGGPDKEVRSESRWRSTLKKTGDGWRISRSIELNRRAIQGRVSAGVTPQEEPKP